MNSRVIPAVNVETRSPGGMYAAIRHIHGRISGGCGLLCTIWAWDVGMSSLQTKVQEETKQQQQQQQQQHW